MLFNVCEICKSVRPAAPAFHFGARLRPFNKIDWTLFVRQPNECECCVELWFYRPSSIKYEIKLNRRKSYEKWSRTFLRRSFCARHPKWHIFVFRYFLWTFPIIFYDYGHLGNDIDARWNYCALTLGYPFAHESYRIRARCDLGPATGNGYLCSSTEWMDRDSGERPPNGKCQMRIEEHFISNWN